MMISSEQQIDQLERQIEQIDQLERQIEQIDQLERQIEPLTEAQLKDPLVLRWLSDTRFLWRLKYRRNILKKLSETT